MRKTGANKLIGDETEQNLPETQRQSQSHTVKKDKAYLNKKSKVAQCAIH